MRKSFYVALCWAMIMFSCSELEYDELVERPASSKTNRTGNFLELRDSAGWSVYAMYFLEKGTGKIKSRIQKGINGNRWYYYECDSVGEYKVIKDVDPFLLMADYELGKVVHSFTYAGDTIRFHRCGYYPKDNPDYSLIVVTLKESVLTGLLK